MAHGDGWTRSQGVWGWTPPAKGAGLHPLALAYVGDSVFELAVRTRALRSGTQRVRELHRQVASLVQAAAQARMLQRIHPALREDEAEIVRRARNVKATVPRNARVQDYRHSTAFEALLGHLYLQGEWERLEEIVELALAAASDSEGRGGAGADEAEDGGVDG